MRLKLTIAALLVAALPCMGQKPHDEYAPKPSPVPCQDTTKVLCIGNSFTYFFDNAIYWRAIGICNKRKKSVNRIRNTFYSIALLHDAFNSFGRKSFRFLACLFILLTPIAYIFDSLSIFIGLGIRH